MKPDAHSSPEAAPLTRAAQARAQPGAPVEPPLMREIDLLRLADVLGSGASAWQWLKEEL
jgi:hypothetical protein